MDDSPKAMAVIVIGALLVLIVMRKTFSGSLRVG